MSTDTYATIEYLDPATGSPRRTLVRVLEDGGRGLHVQRADGHHWWASREVVVAYPVGRPGDNDPDWQQPRARSYRVTFWHAAGALWSRTVEAPNKAAAEAAVRAMFPAQVWSRTSSVVAL